MATFDIYVRIVSFREIRIIGNNPPIINLNLSTNISQWVSDMVSILVINEGRSLIYWITIFRNDRLLGKILGKAFRTNQITSIIFNHAGRLWIEHTTWTMHHVFGDNTIQNVILLGWDLSRNYLINLIFVVKAK